MSNTGGTERMTASLANELIKRGYAVSILSLEPAQKSFFPLQDGIQLASLNIPAAKLIRKYFQAICRLRKFLKRKKVDVIIDVDVILSIISLPAAMASKTKVIAWEHYNYMIKRESKIRVLARKLAARYASVVVTLTKRDAGFYKQHCKCKASIVPILNFISYTPQAISSTTQPIVLAIGSLIKRKGFDYLIDIWAVIKEKHGIGDWNLVILGSGEEKSALEKQIEELGLNDSVQLVPATLDVNSYYAKASVFAMTSLAEGLPMVLIEAKSYGLPIISFDCPTGPADIVRDGEDGFLIDLPDTKVFAEKLHLLMKDDALRMQMREKMADDMVRFMPEKALAEWEKLLRTV